MSYDRLGPRMDEIRKQVAAILAEAEAVDRAEDEEFGEDRRGDELPAELATREGRLAKMREAKEAIEAEAREKAATKAANEVAEDGGGPIGPTPSATPLPPAPPGPTNGARQPSGPVRSPR